MIGSGGTDERGGGDGHISTCSITVTAAGLPEAVEQMLLALFPGDTPDGGHTGSFVLGFGVEADDPTVLIQLAIGEIEALASEQAATIIACEIAGIRRIDDGYRLWGTVECVAAPAGATGQGLHVDAITCEQPDATTWRISAQVMNEDES